jgi:cellulose synthase/poly-beta-1,6-N-acetylglucosamine synthase-like glycosyltransferase
MNILFMNHATIQLSNTLFRFARLLAIPITAVLWIFTIRRIIFTITILFAANRAKASHEQSELPTVLILVPCRDEAEMIPGLCQSIAHLDYPVEKYQLVLIDDGSADKTAELMQQQAQDRAGWHVLTLAGNTGKARALNIALAQFPFGEIIYIFDADHRPTPEAITRAVCYFQNEAIAAVSGFTKVLNPLASSSAYYATVESYVNQLITTRAKNHLGLAPPLLGSNCGYRRQALLKCSGFRNGVFAEDFDLTVAFYKSGYRVCFAEEALSYQQVPQSIQGYLKQHIRWGRGINDVARIHGVEILQNRNLALPLRVELLLFTTGYLDRIALVGAVFLAALSSISKDRFRFSPRIILFSLLTPLAQIITLFIKEHMPREMWLRLPLIPAFFILDIFAAVRAMLDTLLDRSRLWTKTERVGECALIRHKFN